MRCRYCFAVLNLRLASLYACSLVLIFSLLETNTAACAETPATSLYALLVGGGPDVESNAAQIEGHTRFVVGLLPPPARRIVLFADGKSDQPTLSYADTSAAADAQRALAVLLADHDADEPVLTRPPKLGLPPDGPARLQEFRRALSKLSGQAAKAPAPLLLYFAGHGTQDEKNEANTHYDLWDNDELKVRELAEELSRLPRQVPVVLVMAQCFSGAFADVIFRRSDPKEPATEQNVVGFFSARKDREAAGCSYATERADYQDFSSYFFGALSRHDRFGDTITGADSDGDGTVSLHEAFCYALIHDQSADTPVCTSDVFLQQKAPLPDAVIYGTPYQEAWLAATPAQRAVLNELSRQLDLSGEARALAAFDRLTYGDPAARPTLLKTQYEASVQLAAIRQQALPAVFERRPGLRWFDDGSDESKRAFDDAASDLAKDENLRHTLLAAEQTHEQVDEAVENEEAMLMRFASLYEHLVEARELRAHGPPEIKTRFESLWQAEQNALPLVIPH